MKNVSRIMEGSCCLFTDHSGLVPNEPHFQGGQVPGYPRQVPGTPEKQNLTKNLKTGLKLNISKNSFRTFLYTIN